MAKKKAKQEESKKSINLIIGDLRNDLIEVCNQSGLPIAIVELVVKDIYLEVQQTAKNAIEQERQSQSEEGPKIVD